jgi:hypothetical protein
MMVLSLLFAVACSSDSNSESDDPPERSCEVSTAQSGDLCQVNFFCDGEEGPAAYCSDDGACACGPAVENPKEVTIVGICAMDYLDAAHAVNARCGFGL